MRILQIIRSVLALGAPPPIEDEGAFRDWCRKLADLAFQFAGLTDNTLDDKAADVLETVVDVEMYWEALYAILKVAVEYAKDGEELIVGDETDNATDNLSQAVGVDPAMIVMVIEVIVQIVRWWRERK